MGDFLRLENNSKTHTIKRIVHKMMTFHFFVVVILHFVSISGICWRRFKLKIKKFTELWMPLLLFFSHKTSMFHVHTITGKIVQENELNPFRLKNGNYALREWMSVWRNMQNRPPIHMEIHIHSTFFFMLSSKCICVDGVVISKRINII